MKISNLILWLTVVIALSGCINTLSAENRSSNRTNIGNYKSDLSIRADIDISNQVISQFDQQKIEILKRYLASSPRWEIRKEQGKYYAVRKEIVDGKYQSALNGFYYADGAYGTRVILSFGSPYGFGTDYGNITKVSLGVGNTIKAIVEGPHSGDSGYKSYVIFSGNSLNLEIYDKADQKERNFTQKAFKEINKELKEVLTYLKEVKTTGLLPIPERYPVAFQKQLSFNINDGMQPGIYLLEASINPTKEGEVYAKVFDKKTGLRLSEDRITPKSTRMLGWSEKGKTFFSYTSDITVYEGDWDHEYEARFELWHRAVNGHEQKLAETTRKIYGWQR